MNFKTGDTVRLTPEALANKKLSPTLLTSCGFPNRFTVVSAQRVDIEGEGLTDTITLAECCEQVRDIATGAPMCTSHPENLFTLEKRNAPDDTKPECETAIDLPELGRVFSVAKYRKDGASSLVLQVPGLDPLAVTGPWADLAAEQLKKWGIL